MTTEDFNYEKSFKELEDIVSKLESDNSTIKDSLELYKKGMDIYNKLKEYLETVTSEVKIYNSNTEEFENFGS